MIYLTKTGSTTLTSNVNKNTRDAVTTYLLKFTHIMSQDVKTYTIDVLNPTEYGENDRYCELVFDANFTYEGENSLEIYANGTDLVYTGIVIVGEQTETFVQYTSNNENNSNYIYVE